MIQAAAGSVVPGMSLDIAATLVSYSRAPARSALARRRFAGRSGQRTVHMTDTEEAGLDREMAACLAKVGAQGDIEAFEALFRHFAPRLRAYMARGGNGMAADELMQETMATVWRKAALYDPAKGSAAAWVFSIARNQRIDAYRRSSHPTFDVNDPALVPEEEVPADRQFEAQEAAAQLRKALVTLPVEQIEVLQLSFFEGETHSAIARRLDLPMGTVKSRLRLALNKLRALLGDAGETE